MFELAKLVFTKNFENDIPFRNKRIAECLLKLGEISIEQEIYEQAITDITESIRLQEEQKEERDERMLAESFYQLGLAQQFSNLFTEANESYQKSINIVQLRIEKLKAKLTQLGEEAENESERTTVKDEINDLNDLLPEMTSKLEELSEQGQQSMKLVKEAIINNTVGEAAAVPTVTNGEVKDITGLVKSKRKNTEEDSSTIKKTRLSEANEPETTNNGTEQMTA
jgi:nuclear autoantigenic sperm protein